MARYLVTGGCGFIGSHLVELLLASGHDVRILDDLSTGLRDNAPPQADLVQADVADAAAVKAAMRDVNGCFHLAAIASVERTVREWAGSHRTNLTGTINVLDAAARSNVPVVYVSSAAVYGAATDMPLSEDSSTAPISAYGADKLGCELHARVASLVHGVPTVGVRPFNVYGPRQLASSPYAGVISVFARLLLEGRPLTICGDGEQVRDFIYVGDVVRALCLAMDRSSARPQVFCLCTGRPTAILELARTMAELVGVRPRIVHVPARRADIRTSFGSPLRAARILGFSANVELRAGLAKTLEWAMQDMAETASLSPERRSAP